MKEITFINRNKTRWETFEQQLRKPTQVRPDSLADQFIQLTDDLAYARTFYPGSHTLAYLNSLSQKTHQEVYRNKREKGSRLPRFFKIELPLVLHSARPYFLISLLIFIAAWTLGVVSALDDAGFVRAILGDSYVNMTLDNIERGDPMAVYGQMGELPMSFYIIFNNVNVSWNVFLYGFLTPLGAAYGLFQNGVMVGAFQAFFYQKNLLAVSTYAIMIHGTLELSAIVLAGGAGIMLGRYMLFPGTYPRKDAFIYGTLKGVKVMLPVTLLFFTAGILESFVTRHYNSINHWLNILIIAASLLIIIGYFFVYPSIVYSKFKNK
ncbi:MULTISPECIES: stage II sporulation protein M [unclassified Carboxylicivirga]|uniref:stage II sporulation protein M n=1 Tax=Carboxylicivirga TaxID=1628153 RepID=UPI003D34E6E2